MSGKKGQKGDPPERGNESSPAQEGPARPWTAEEMADARPLPLPDGGGVKPQGADPTSGVPHAGEGMTAPGGRPEGKP